MGEQRMGEFNGSCFDCWKRVHRAKECFGKATKVGSKKGEYNKRENEGCFGCDDPGHTARKCPYRGNKGGNERTEELQDQGQWQRQPLLRQRRSEESPVAILSQSNE